jgi:hypothetical protein
MMNIKVFNKKKYNNPVSLRLLKQDLVVCKESQHSIIDWIRDWLLTLRKMMKKSTKSQVAVDH